MPKPKPAAAVCEWKESTLRPDRVHMCLGIAYFNDWRHFKFCPYCGGRITIKEGQ